jgi:hypothetical protein
MTPKGGSIICLIFPRCVDPAGHLGGFGGCRLLRQRAQDLRQYGIMSASRCIINSMLLMDTGSMGLHANDENILS